MIIGNFTYDPARDTLHGRARDPRRSRARTLVFQPNEGRDDKAPSETTESRIVSPAKGGDIELGAAWKKRSEEGRDYLSVKLDDPALTQPLNCALVESSDSEGFILVWSRDSRKSKADVIPAGRAARAALAARNRTITCPRFFRYEHQGEGGGDAVSRPARMKSAAASEPSPDHQVTADRGIARGRAGGRHIRRADGT